MKVEYGVEEDVPNEAVDGVRVSLCVEEDGEG
jgi:hypothetical protein